MNKDNSTKKYFDVAFDITGVILPKTDLRGLSEEERLKALDDAYLHGKFKNTFSVGGGSNVKAGVFEASAHCYIEVEATDVEQAKALAAEKINTMDFGDIQNAAWNFVYVKELDKQTKSVKKSSEDRER